MARAKSFILLSIAAWVAACVESTGPPVPESPLVRPDGELHHLKWQSTTEPRQFSVGRLDEGPLMAPAQASGPVLDHNRVAFWAFPGRGQSIQINYRDADGTWRPYVGFSVPRGSLLRWPDGRLFTDSDSVLITVSIDTTTLIAQFEPTGLVFSSRVPAQLTVWYTGADPDFDGNGRVDWRDSYIERRLLGVWVQESAGDPWTGVAAVQSLWSKTFTSSLKHFSGYAVSW